MSLSNILKEIEANRPNAEMDLTLGNPSTERARLGAKRAAAANIKELRTKYTNELLASVAFIVVTGTNKDTFSGLAAAEAFGCLSTDPEEFFKDLTSRVNPALYGREGARQLFNIASNILEDKAIELGISEYNMLQFNEKYNRSVKNAEEFTQLIKEAINDQIGCEMVGYNSVHSVVDNAIKKGHTANVTPIVLNTEDEKFALDLAKNLKRRRLTDGTFRGVTDNVFLVVAGKASKPVQSTEGAIVVKNVSEESVAEALAKVRNRIL